MKKGENGITLIALVVTIIILLILAGVTLSTALSDNGLFQKSKQAKNTWINSVEKENTTLHQWENTMDNLFNEYGFDATT